MKVVEKIKKFLNRNNPELISDEIAQVFNKRKENGEKDPMDNTVKDIMRILKEHPDIERAILANIVENDKIPDKIFEKTAIKISESEEIPNSVITDVVQRSNTNISDESISRIIENGNIDLQERIKLICNVEDEQIIEENVKNELKILYKVCKEKKDYEVVERVEKLKELLNNEINENVEKLISQVVAKKMAENYYSDTKKGTRIYGLSKIIPVEDMIEKDLPNMVEEEYKKIEENEGNKKGRFNKKELKIQILTEMAKNIAYKYDETGVFIIPQSENMKAIDKEEEEMFIKSIQTYSRKQLSKQEVIDIDEQVRGNFNNVQIKESMLINVIKSFPEKNKNKNIDILTKIASSDEKKIEILSMIQESGLIDKISELPEDKINQTIEIMGKVIEKRNNTELTKQPKIENQKLEIYAEEKEDR